jgi:hypothetical protein
MNDDVDAKVTGNRAYPPNLARYVASHRPADTPLTISVDLLHDAIAASLSSVDDRSFPARATAADRSPRPRRERGEAAPHVPLRARRAGSGLLGFGADGRERRPEDIEAVGTRHGPAYRFVHEHPTGLAIVISHDGGVSFVANRDGEVVFWERSIGP